ncbi:MAG: hypothetical protein PHE17_11255 [Thiothrix sp.]|uniref:hypothetical protein n=1 Tax=Thiothrix sp. TaxID=1032 RepID=UPI002634E51C|nr:hypothetical protein [Thiothrix sp.]MDD5393585.1 hypothetical protein [Thiothrix sp.]
MKRYILTTFALCCFSSTLWAAGNYPVKNFKPSPKADVQAFESVMQAVAAQSPKKVLTPLQLLRGLPMDAESKVKTYTWCAKPVHGKQVCTLREENLPDDSVAGSLQKITFTATKTAWQVTAIQRAWRCQVGRGNAAAYQTRLCK